MVAVPNPIKSRYKKAEANLSGDLYVLSDGFKLSLEKEHGIDNPSTGFLAVFFMTRFFSRVSLYGFSFYQTENIHYWEDHEDNSDHDWSKEKSVISSLEKVECN